MQLFLFIVPLILLDKAFLFPVDAKDSSPDKVSAVKWLSKLLFIATFCLF